MLFWVKSSEGSFGKVAGVFVERGSIVMSLVGVFISGTGSSVGVLGVVGVGAMISCKGGSCGGMRGSTRVRGGFLCVIRRVAKVDGIRLVHRDFVCEKIVFAMREIL